jgi:hypothetical protein
MAELRPVQDTRSSQDDPTKDLHRSTMGSRSLLETFVSKSPDQGFVMDLAKEIDVVHWNFPRSTICQCQITAGSAIDDARLVEAGTDALKLLRSCFRCLHGPAEAD